MNPLELDYSPRLPALHDHGIAIVGCGGIVNAGHLPAYSAHHLNVIACFDTEPGQARDTAQRHGIPIVYDSLEALLADERVNIVDIAVPAAQQRGVAERALAAGKHLLCQKPLAESLKDAQAIVDAGRQAGCKVAVNQQMRWSAGIAAAKQLISSGVLGTPTDVQIQVSTNTPWHLWPWLRDSERLEVMYHSIHHLDSLRYLFGTPVCVSSHFARFPNQAERGETKTLTVLEFEGGAQGLVAVNHHDASGEGYATYRFLGTEGLIQGTIGLLYDYPKGRPDTLQVRSKHISNGVLLEVPLEGLWIPDAFIGPMASLMESIETNGTPITDAVDHLDTLRTVFAAYTSATEHRTVRLEEVR